MRAVLAKLGKGVVLELPVKVIPVGVDEGPAGHALLLESVLEVLAEEVRDFHRLLLRDAQGRHLEDLVAVDLVDLFLVVGPELLLLSVRVGDLDAEAFLETGGRENEPELGRLIRGLADGDGLLAGQDDLIDRIVVHPDFGSLVRAGIRYCRARQGLTRGAAERDGLDGSFAPERQDQVAAQVAEIQGRLLRDGHHRVGTRRETVLGVCLHGRPLEGELAVRRELHLAGVGIETADVGDRGSAVRAVAVSEGAGGASRTFLKHIAECTDIVVEEGDLVAFVPDYITGLVDGDLGRAVVKSGGDGRVETLLGGRGRVKRAGGGQHSQQAESDQTFCSHKLTD